MGVEELPERFRLSWLLGEIVRFDTSAENEARVLWRRLRAAGLGKGDEHPRDFGRLLPELRKMVNEDGVPAAFRDIASKSIDRTVRVHAKRAELVHEILIHGDWSRGKVATAFGSKPPRTIDQIERISKDLQRAMAEMRGLWITAPHWVGGPLEDFVEVDYMRSWTRVAMGHLADSPTEMRGTPGPSPDPPGGWLPPVGHGFAESD